MTVCVYGLWHLGTVTAACLASRGIATVGLAETSEAAAELKAGKAPLFEPGLSALLAQGLQAGTLSFNNDIAAGKHVFELTVSDNKNNDAHYSADFYR